MPGSTLHGFLYALPTLGLPMVASAGSASDGDGNSWPTPTLTGNHNTAGSSEKAGDGLATSASKWPTPSSMDGRRVGKGDCPEHWKLHAAKHAARGVHAQFPLNIAVNWPTPAAGNPNDGEDPASWEERRQRNLAKGYNGNGQGLPLGIAVQGSAWPTPMASDHRSGLEGPETLASNSRPLRVAVANPSLWPTPRAGSETGGGAGLDGGAGSRAMMDKVLAPEERAAMISHGQLNPDWVELLMGWPLGWTSLEPCAGVWPGWPMGMGPDQHPYEPPRTVPKGTIRDRSARLKMLGNGVVEQQAALAFLLLLQPAIPFLGVP